MEKQWYVIEGENGHIFLQDLANGRLLKKGQKLPSNSMPVRKTGCLVGRYATVKAVCNPTLNAMFDALDSLGNLVADQSSKSPHFIVELESLFREIKG